MVYRSGNLRANLDNIFPSHKLMTPCCVLIRMLPKHFPESILKSKFEKHLELGRVNQLFKNFPIWKI